MARIHKPQIPSPNQILICKQTINMGKVKWECTVLNLEPTILPNKHVL